MVFPCQGILLFLLSHIDVFLFHIIFGSGWIMNKMSIDTFVWNKWTTLFQRAVLGILERVYGWHCCKRSVSDRRAKASVWSSQTAPGETSPEQGSSSRKEHSVLGCVGATELNRKVSDVTWLVLRTPIKGGLSQGPEEYLGAWDTKPDTGAGPPRQHHQGGRGVCAAWIQLAVGTCSENVKLSASAEAVLPFGWALVGNYFSCLKQQYSLGATKTP